MTAGRALRIAIAIAVVAVIALYVRGLDWPAIADSARAASIPLLVLSALGNVPLIWLKAQRLRVLVDGKVAMPRLMQMYVASYAADNLVMSQAGIGVRVALLAREGLTVAAAVTTQVVEKVIEGVGLAIIALPLLASDDLDFKLRTTLRICLILGAVGAVALVALARVRGKDTGVFKRIGDVSAVLRDPRNAARLIGITLAAWVVEYGMVAVALAATHVDVSPMGPIVVLVAVNLAALIPGLPANIGPFEMACVLALGSGDATSEAALGFALLYHAIHTIPVTIAGILPAFRPVSS
jgi:uncharacterized membrane protein YbhN (UPF0104 family)